MVTKYSVIGLKIYYAYFSLARLPDDHCLFKLSAGAEGCQRSGEVVCRGDAQALYLQVFGSFHRSPLSSAR